MTARRLFSLGIALFACSSIAATVASDAQRTPHEIIEATAATVSERLDGRKDYFDENPDELYTLVDDVLLPNFDVRYAGRLVLGKHWKAASREQRDRFVDVFYRFLVQSYANGILEFEQGSIKVLPPEGESGQKRVVVKTQTRMDDGSEVPINYSMRRTRDGWRVYDVRIEGVSYVQNYRNQFNAEIAALGVDAVIDRLNDQVAAAAAVN
ncbi:MAG: MlaC/ttg2D family ABC transporter substrate-binding protein [Gammaproteobacteria bacterium]